MPVATRPNPTYEEVCSSRTGHAEVVLVAYDPTRISYEQLLKTFWEAHDPTQGMRQGNDLGTSYRSIILVADDEQRAAAEASKAMYQEQPVGQGLRHDHDRDRRSPPTTRSTTPRTTTSSTSTRTRAATARTTRPA